MQDCTLFTLVLILYVYIVIVFFAFDKVFIKEFCYYYYYYYFNTLITSKLSF